MYRADQYVRTLFIESMSEFSFYPEKYQKKLRDNYIAFFLKQASSQYLEANYPTEYIKHSLHSMSLFGDWLQKMRIPLQVVDRQHINMFVEYAKSHLPRRSVHVESARKRTAKLAVSLIRKHSPPQWIVPRSLKRSFGTSITFVIKEIWRTLLLQHTGMESMNSCGTFFQKEKFRYDK